MSDWRGFSDTRRGLLRVSGADARPFLQGLITNDVDRLETGGSIYAAMLSAQGKYQFDFHVFDASALAPDALILDIASDRLESLAKRLNMYRLRRDVEIADASAEYGVALAWNGVFENFGMCGANTIISPDSRSPELGVRIIAPTPDQALKALGAAPASPAEYDALRVALGVPESGAELIADASYILENRFEALNGVDFRKGCYVGQEVTARMKHKTELRKRSGPRRDRGRRSGAGDRYHGGRKARRHALHLIRRVGSGAYPAGSRPRGPDAGGRRHRFP